MKIVKKVFAWGIAFCLGFLLVNLLCFFYERPVAWINRSSSVTSGVRRPNSVLVHGTEGYGITHLDENGYTNAKKPLIDDGYVLIMGSSHIQGKEVADEEKINYLLDRYISGENSDYLSVYNVATDSHTLPVLLKRFQAGVEEYPNASSIVLEISDTDYSVDSLEDALQQVHYDENDSAENLFKNASFKTKARTYVKEYFPLMTLYKTKLETARKNKKSDATQVQDSADYAEVMNNALAMIRSEYDGNIIFAYHPETEIDENGIMTCVKSDTYETFSRLCEENDIILLDVSDAFLEHYEETSEVPYGFWNTKMGSGHLNATGHKIMADELYELLKEVK